MSVVGRDVSRMSIDRASRRHVAANDYLTVQKEEVDDELVIIESNSKTNVQNGLHMQTTLPIETSQGHDESQYVTSIEYEEDLTPLNSSMIGDVNNHSSIQSNMHSTGDIEYGFSHKRRRTSPMLANTMEIQDREYEDSANMMYDYDAEYEAASVLSGSSYANDQQRTLAEVLNYCQAMYEIVHKLDKKLDSLQRKVAEMHPVRLKYRMPVLPPRGFHPSAHGKVRAQKVAQRPYSSQAAPPPPGYRQSPSRMRAERNICPQPTLSYTSAPTIPHPVEQHQRRSPPLPTIISTRSLQPSFSAVDVMPKSSQTIVEALSGHVPSPIDDTSLISLFKVPQKSETCIGEVEEPVGNCAAPPESIINEEQPSSSVPSIPNHEYVGDPSRNIKVPAHYLIKAKRKTKPKYAARCLFRALFPKETLRSSLAGTNSKELSSLDVCKVSALKEFLVSAFPEFDLRECGKDWEGCVRVINTFIHRLLSEKNSAKDKRYRKSVSEMSKESICADSDSTGNNEDTSTEAPKLKNKKSKKTNSQSTSTKSVNPKASNMEPDDILTGSLANRPSVDHMEYLGVSWRNVQLPFSVVRIAKGKTRPELSARYLIRHLFTDDILLTSNVYGNVERGILPLESNKIDALQEFLQKNYPAFDLTENGTDWKACVAAVNSTIHRLHNIHRKSDVKPPKKPLWELRSKKRSNKHN